MGRTALNPFRRFEFYRFRFEDNKEDQMSELRFSKEAVEELMAWASDNAEVKEEIGGQQSNYLIYDDYQDDATSKAFREELLRLLNKKDTKDA